MIKVILFRFDNNDNKWKELRTCETTQEAWDKIYTSICQANENSKSKTDPFFNKYVNQSTGQTIHTLSVSLF